MRRLVIGLATIMCLVTGCVSGPPPSAPPTPSEPPPSGSTATSGAPSPSAGPSSFPSASASASPSAPSASPEQATEPPATPAPFPTDTTATDVPAGLGDIAWAGLRMDSLDTAPRTGVLFGGLLGSAPTIRAAVTNPVGAPNAVTAGGRVAVVEERGPGRAAIRVWQAADGLEVADVDVPSLGAQVLLDPDRPLVYTAELRPGGGLDVRRHSLGGDVNDLLLTLDRRFTPDGIPSERYGMVLDPDGVLLVEACGSADGCRLWEVPPDVAPAPRPRTLPGHPPIVCSVIAATRAWLIVSDDASCWADTSDAPLPVRAIRRADGASHVVTDDHVGIGRAIELGGRTWLVGADRIFAGSDVAIVRYDVASGAKDVLIRSLPAAPSEQTYEVSPDVLPGSWVLLRPWFIEATSIPELPGRLLDVGSGETVELPIGTFGWS